MSQTKALRGGYRDAFWRPGEVAKVIEWAHEIHKRDAAKQAKKEETK